MTFHIIPFDESAAREWSERAEIPWENTEQIMKLRRDAEDAKTFPEKIEKLVSDFIARIHISMAKTN